MCELLGMSANVPTDICFSFSGLIRRSGQTGPHRDGWGITFYEGKGSRTFKDPNPGIVSPIAKLVSQYPIKSRVVISHIRRASRGKVSLENTHPFSRELWGEHWTFAHNGTLKKFREVPVGEFYQPIGTTDSEHAFCFMLNGIRKAFPKKPQDIGDVLPLMKTLFTKLHKYGTFNVLLTDGQHLFAHCSTNLYWIIRKAPFGKARLLDCDMKVDFKRQTSPKDVVAIIATHPLTKDEHWIQMAKGEFLVFKDGMPI